MPSPEGAGAQETPAADFYGNGAGVRQGAGQEKTDKGCVRLVTAAA